MTDPAPNPSSESDKTPPRGNAAAAMVSVGHLLDNTYRLIRVVGEGGMGTVYEATHARLAGRYAIKVLLQKLSENPEALARFQREARITSLLQHPNVVEVIDFNTTTDGTEFLVMEYLAGESLAERLFHKGPIPLDEVVGIVDQIAAGLAAAHAHGIVHRDLKPDNVFLVPVEGRETESVKILDFGISQVKDASLGRQIPDGGLCGTPQYMAPEQIGTRPANVGAPTDQFALAVITYEMLTGRNPFRADTVGEILSRVLSEDPAPMGIDRDVDLVVRRGLAKAGRARFASITDFSDALRAAAARRARGGHRVATLASYAAGELAVPEKKRKPQPREWRMALIAMPMAILSISFVARKQPPHPISPIQAVSPKPPAAEQARPMAAAGQRSTGQPAPAETAAPVPPMVLPVIVPVIVSVAKPASPADFAPEHVSSPDGRPRRHGELGRTARLRRSSLPGGDEVAATLLPGASAQPPPPARPFPVDEDATMPPSPASANP